MARSARIPAICPTCSNPYKQTPSRPAKHCSVACYNRSRSGKSRGPYVERESKSCSVCQAVFNVGGYGNPRRTQQFCSIECQRKARYRSGRISNELSVVDAAYLAGIIDGEGSVMLYMRRDVVAVRVTVANTAMILLEWIFKKTGVGSVLTKDRTPDRHKPAGWWQVNADAAYSILKQIRPYLVVKAAQADLAMETIERLRTPALKTDRAWQGEYRLRMKAMNRRGPIEALI